MKGKQTYLPLYEAKMVQAYDHRAADVVTDEANWVRQGQTAKTSLVEHGKIRSTWRRRDFGSMRRKCESRRNDAHSLVSRTSPVRRISAR